jgi:hypothetical protein
MAQHADFAGFRRLLSVRTVAAIGVAAGLASIVGCKVDDALGPTSNQGVVQFINAAPRYASADLFVDTTNAIPALPYGNGTSIYVKALASPRQFTVRNSADMTPLATGQLVVADQQTYAMILTQRSTGGGLLVLPDTVSVPPSGDIGLRVVNVAPSAGPVDVYITGADTALSTPVAANVPYEGVMTYQNVAAGPKLRVRVTAAGTKTVLLDVDASALRAGQVRTIVVVDADGGGLPLTWLGIPDIG